MIDIGFIDEFYITQFRAWMFPHNFVVKEIEFWSGYNWGTIKLESAQARNVLLEHAKYHPFKPFTDGKSYIFFQFYVNVSSGDFCILYGTKMIYLQNRIISFL